MTGVCGLGVHARRYCVGGWFHVIRLRSKPWITVVVCWLFMAKVACHPLSLQAFLAVCCRSLSPKPKTQELALSGHLWRKFLWTKPTFWIGHSLEGSVSVLTRKIIFEGHQVKFVLITRSMAILMSVWPCIIVDMKRVKPTRCYTMVYWTLWISQHVSGITMPIIRSLRLYRWSQRVAPHLGYGTPCHNQVEEP